MCVGQRVKRLSLSLYNHFFYVCVSEWKIESFLIKSVYFCVCVAEWKDWFFVDIISHCWISEIWLRVGWFWVFTECLWFPQSGILWCILITFGNLCFSFLALYSCSSIYIQLKKFIFHFVSLCVWWWWWSVAESEKIGSFFIWSITTVEFPKFGWVCWFWGRISGNTFYF